jgi:hypothetical protein
VWCGRGNKRGMFARRLEERGEEFLKKYRKKKRKAFIRVSYMFPWNNEKVG